MSQEKLQKAIEKAKGKYPLQEQIRCPYFQGNIFLTSDGFNHLQYKGNRMLRARAEIISPFSSHICTYHT